MTVNVNICMAVALFAIRLLIYGSLAALTMYVVGGREVDEMKATMEGPGSVETMT